MAQINTVEDLSNKIIEEISWRRKELNIFKNQIPINDGVMRKAYLRAGTAMLYAHWEGYVKNTCNYYLHFVSVKQIPLQQLKPGFIYLCYADKLKGSTNMNKGIIFVEEFFDNLTKADYRSNIPKNSIDTKSNLWYPVFAEIMHLLCLDVSHLKFDSTLIDDLVRARNIIAHGEYNSIDEITYLKFYDEINIYMEGLRNTLENAALLGSYKINRV